MVHSAMTFWDIDLIPPIAILPGPQTLYINEQE